MWFLPPCQTLYSCRGFVFWHWLHRQLHIRGGAHVALAMRQHRSILLASGHRIVTWFCFVRRPTHAVERALWPCVFGSNRSLFFPRVASYALPWLQFIRAPLHALSAHPCLAHPFPLAGGKGCDGLCFFALCASPSHETPTSNWRTWLSWLLLTLSNALLARILGTPGRSLV